MELSRKLEILADAAKYDASCASSAAPKRDSRGRTGLGASTGAGICHSFTPDGRCVSLLKILLTNFCQYDCLYCVNRRSSNVPRARFRPAEVVDLTLDFYRRNYIDGLFLSSGIIRSSDYTMESLVEVARSLREDHHFRGYIHLKTIPDADPQLITLAGLYADRLSVNIELPTDAGLSRLAPEKSGHTIKRAMGVIRLSQEQAQEAKPADVVAAGRELFNTWSCSACHTLSDAGSSGAVGPSLDNPSLTHDFIVNRVTNGSGPMPSFGGQISEAEIGELADYIVAVNHKDAKVAAAPAGADQSKQ